MNKIYLHKEDIKAIEQFMDAFDSNSVEVTSENSSGIGAVVKATIPSIEVKGITVNVTRVISDENDW